MEHSSALQPASCSVQNYWDCYHTNTNISHLIRCSPSIQAALGVEKCEVGHCDGTVLPVNAIWTAESDCSSMFGTAIRLCVIALPTTIIVVEVQFAEHNAVVLLQGRPSDEPASAQLVTSHQVIVQQVHCHSLHGTDGH